MRVLRPTSMTRPGRLVLLVTALAMLVPLVPAVPAANAEVTLASLACPDDLVTDVVFEDIAGSTHEEAISCLVAREITLGVSPTVYAPAQSVRRDQMASFLVRLIEQLDLELPAGGESFPDVVGSTHEDAIARLAAVGIVQGVEADRYDPGRAVTRAQMATFLVRTFEYVTDADLRSDAVAFTDIDGSVHLDNIVKVATAGIALGTSASTYEPARPVRRDQMASFLTRLLDRLLDPVGGLPELSFAVDEDLEPTIPQLPADDEADPRPLAALRDGYGTDVDVVLDELLVVGPQSDLDAFLIRWGGTLITTIDPGELAAQLPDDVEVELELVHLVRVDASGVDVSDLEEVLAAADEPVFGAHTVSDELVLGLLMIAASAAQDGLVVALNPVLYPDDALIDWDLADAPVLASDSDVLGGGAYSPNPADWPHFASGTTQDIGVTDAWRALALAGQADPSPTQRIGIAIFDGGFANLDLPPGSSGANNVPGFGVCGGNPCPWHGTSVAQVAAAVPGNGQLTAGSGGPVAAASVYGVSLSLSDRIAALAVANPFAGPVFPRIINMSFGGAVPRVLAIPLKPLVNGIMNAFFFGGALPVASAGNEGQHVNERDCGWFTCYEVAQWLPCQADRVLCVGGLATDSLSHHANSNWGADVELWAPFTHYVGPEPGTGSAYIPPPNELRTINGTSFSAPFVSGIAALVVAADRSLTSAQLRDVLLDTSRAGSGNRVTRVVQARDAVHAAFGQEGFTHQITLPAAGDELVRGRTFNARSERSRSGLTVVWRLDGEQVASGATATQQIPPSATRDLDPGTYELSATVSSGPYTLTRTTDIEIVNQAPTVRIDQPEPNAEIYVSDPAIAFRAQVTNPERSLEDDEITWEVARPGAGAEVLGSGRELAVPASALGEGTWTVSALADDGVDVGSDSIEVEVQPDPLVPPPIVSIVDPEDGAFYIWEGLLDGSLFYADVLFTAEAVESAADPTPLAPEQLSWSSAYQWLQDPSSPEQTEDHGTGNPKEIRITTPGSCSGGTDHYVTVTATNSAGAQRSATIRVWVRGPVC